MKSLISFLFCSMLAFPSLLEAQNYSVANIPDSLRENANAIKRFEELTIEIKSPDKAIRSCHYAITVLNEAGDTWADYTTYYDSFDAIEKLSGSLYDAAGHEIKQVKEKDFEDRSYQDGISLISDGRVKEYSFYHRTYPYTVEFEERHVIHGLFSHLSWKPFDDEKIAVQSSRFIVKYPKDYIVRYKQIALVESPIAVVENNTTVYTWEIHNRKAIVYESFMPDVNEKAPSVYIAPSVFEMAGYTGDMSSWQTLGLFHKKLNEGRDILPEQIKKEIHQLTDGISSTEEKTKIIYEYVQKNTRYIGIQLGIGGWQPFKATEVAEKRYGDCKGLSNFTVSLLKEAGVKGYYVLIMAGKGKKTFWEDFPSPQFNHIVVCVPNGKDSIWLECTSATESAGYMGSFTGNRRALLISEEGGKVVYTPSYSAKDNRVDRKITAVIAPTGDLDAKVHTLYSGIEQELQHNIIHYFTKEQKEQYLNSYIGLPTYTILQNKYQEQKGRIPVIMETLHIHSPSFVSVAGKRLFITPNLLDKWDTRFFMYKERLFDIDYPYAYFKRDSVEMSVPEGYQAESVPTDVIRENKFGTYSLRFNVSGNKIIMVRTIERNAAVFSRLDYPLLVSFYEELYKADRSKIVFVKKE